MMDNLRNFRKAGSIFTIELNENFSLYIDRNIRYQRFKTFNLQKGLTLAYKGHEILGGDMGFGIPVIKYDGVFFS